MSYRNGGMLGPLGAEESTPEQPGPALKAVVTKRGWVAVPARDVREHLMNQLTVLGFGILVGFGVGAAVGTMVGRRKMRPNAR